MHEGCVWKSEMARQLQSDCDLLANAALLPVVCQCMSCMALYAVVLPLQKEEVLSPSDP